MLLRSDHNTHSLTTGDRYVKLAFRPRDDEDDGEDEHEGGRGPRSGKDGELRVTAPKVPAQAIPGIYMLFVVDTTGVPSVGKQVRLTLEERGHSGDGENHDASSYRATAHVLGR